MARRRATHKGTCQCCGRLQKLPFDVLSKHGYRVVWGYFNGICQGSDRDPLEKDRAYLDKTVVALREYADREEAGEPERLHLYIGDKYVNYQRQECWVPNDFEAFKKAALENREGCRYCGWYTWDDEEIRRHFEDAQRVEKGHKQRRAVSAREHADWLLKLAEEVHGRPLQEI